MGLNDMEPKDKKKLIYVGSVIAVLAVFFFISGSIFETNNSGYYQVKQAALSGEMSVRNEPGLYGQWFGTITTYKVSDAVFFSKEKTDGGSGELTKQITVRFNDGSTAEINGVVLYRMPSQPKKQLLLHREFRSHDSVKYNMVRQHVIESLKNTATLMKAEEAYSTRRSEFSNIAEKQVLRGIYETESEERLITKEKDSKGRPLSTQVEKIVRIKKDKNGNPLIAKPSPLTKYGIELIQFTIKDVDFDETIDRLIAKKKEAEQQKVVAKANAERAKQDAITEEEQGKARIAKAKADELVEKIKAVTQAQKEFEVAQFERKKASEEAKSKLLRGEAEARIAKLKVAAGLTPLQKAEILKETKIGVAAELAKTRWPKFMIFGGGKGGAANPFDAIGIQAYMKIIDKMSSQE